MNKDLNYIANLEKAISKQFGHEATINPKSLWTPDKEEHYLEESKQSQIKQSLAEKTQERIEINGVLIPKKLINKNTNRHCQYCNTYSFDRDNEIYLAKYGTCYKCFVEYVQDREERWANGWRPKTEHKNGT